jgi:hypothetical protein
LAAGELANAADLAFSSSAGDLSVQTVATGLVARDFVQTHMIFVCYAEPADGGGRVAVSDNNSGRILRIVPAK